jgi:ribosomal protein L21E
MLLGTGQHLYSEMTDDRERLLSVRSREDRLERFENGGWVEVDVAPVVERAKPPPTFGSGGGFSCCRLWCVGYSSMPL